MSITKSHVQNLASNRWQNSRVMLEFSSQAPNILIWVRHMFLVPLFITSLAAQADTPVFEIGKFSLNPSKQIPRIQPVADYLASHMEPFGYENGKASVFPDFESARQAMASGSLDTMTTSLYEAAQMIRGGQATPLAVKWKNDSSEYSSLIIVRADSDIYELQDLAGKTIAFEDYGSSSAFFIPYMTITDSGLALSHQENPDEHSNTVHYRFTGAVQNSSVLLFQNRVDAIALSDYDWLKPDHVPKQQRDNFRILWVSQPYPAAVEILNSQIPPEQRAFLRNTLIRMHLNDEGQGALNEYHESSRFSRLSDEIRTQLERFVEFLETEQFPSEY